MSQWPCDVLPVVCVADILHDRFLSTLFCDTIVWSVLKAAGLGGYSGIFMAHCLTLVKHLTSINKVSGPRKIGRHNVGAPALTIL